MWAGIALRKRSNPGSCGFPRLPVAADEAARFGERLHRGMLTGGHGAEGHLRAWALAAILLPAPFSVCAGALAQAGDGAKPDAAACEAHEIATAIRGCTALIDGGGLSGEKLAQAYLQPRKGLRQAVLLRGGHRRFQPRHRTRSQERESLSGARPGLRRTVGQVPRGGGFGGGDTSGPQRP